MLRIPLKEILQSGYTAVLLVMLLWPVPPAAADNDNSDATAATPAPSFAGPAPEYSKADKRILGVLPNYRSVESSVPFHPLTPRQKLGIAAHDSFDWPTFLVTGAYAGIYQMENQNPKSGQGLHGYAKRFTTT